MKANDIIAGAVFFALAAFIFIYALTLPPMPGQRYGAGAYPTVIALAMAGFAVLLIWRALRARTTAMRWFEIADWARNRRNLGTFALALVLILAYVFLAEPVGFIPASIGILLILFLRQREPFGRSLVIAVAATLAIQFAFADMLRVPLPRGILTEYLW